MSQAASVITAMEFLQIVVFFIGVAYLYVKSVNLVGTTAKASTSISDYSIMVTHLPADATDAELVEHFNSLYQLAVPDYLNRPALEGAEVVTETDNSNDMMHYNTWIAECIVHKGIGGFISAFKAKQHILQKLYRARAKMKMYAENSSHADGHNLSLFQAAEKDVLATAKLIDHLTEHNIKKWKLTFIQTDAQGKTAKKRQVSNPESIYYNINADTVAAFVCFEYAESLARCVRDYEKYNTFPMSLFYPEALKFKGHAIHVQQAPEPDQIVWENIEVPPSKKIYLRVRTAFITAFLVVGCFIIILQASIYKNIFSAQIPSAKLCETTIPSVYANGSAVSDYTLQRPPNSVRALYDAQCQAIIAGTFYAVYTHSSNFTNTVVKYDLSSCTDSSPTYATHSQRKLTTATTDGICPLYDTKSYCPCVSITDSTSCDNAFCATQGQDSSSCDVFEAGDIGACYCYTELKSTITTKGIATTMNRLSQLSSGICRKFFGQYSLSVGLTYVSVFTTTIVNILMRKFLKQLATHEAHTSNDAEQGSIMTKIFFSNYATMAIIVLLAYGKTSHLPAFFKAVHIFNGPYDDFNQSWYGSIGFYLMTTFILQSFSPLASNLVMYYFLHPVLRWFHHERVAENRSHAIVMQHDLNMLEVGPVFDPTDHTAQLLTLLFFSMTYAPGLPLLTPLCCFAFSLYFRVDKVLLCRWFQKPPQVGDAAIRNVLALLPYAAVVRLAIACWMYGNQDVMSTSTNLEGTYDRFLERARHSSAGLTYAQDRIFRPNVFPLFILLLFLIAVLVIRRLWKELPIYWIFKGLNLLRHFFTQSDIFAGKTDDGKITAWDLLKLDDPLRMQSAGLTKEYFRFIKHRDEIPDTCLKMFSYAYLTQMSEMEVEEGWKIEDRGDFVVKVKIWREEHRRSNGTKLRVGTLKRTYEVIADHRCSSYNIERVPAYYLAMRGLREGASSLMEPGLASKTTHSSTPHFFGEHHDIESGKDSQHELDDQADLKKKHKKQAHHSPSNGGTVAVSNEPEHRPRSPVPERPKTQETAKPAAKQATQAHPHGAAPTKKNFTIDDFEGMEAGESTAMSAALEARREEDERIEHDQAEKARKKAEKDKKKKKANH